MITYSLLWPKKNINKGEEIFIDYLANISENEELAILIFIFD